VTPSLHARTVALQYGPDALQFDASPTVLFDRPGLTLAGWGTALLVPASEAASTLAAIPSEDEVGRLGSGPLALGALPFHGPMDGLMVIPRFTMAISRDADGVTRRWATAVGPAGTPLPGTEELFDAVIWQYGDGSAPPVVDPAVTELDSLMTAGAYAGAVAEAVSAMRSATDRALRKVVLSRSVHLGLDGPLPLVAVLRRLRAAEPDCTIFAMPVPDGTFFGASPELLVARHGDRVSCHPLAGTVPRGPTARADADAQRALARSAKSQVEHRYVVDDVVGALGPLCRELSVPAEPSLVTFRSVAHLGTRVEGRLAETLSVLDLVEMLHPTAAVGGTPREEALSFIATHEAGSRGFWAGPVGWVDLVGQGEWMIAIRSALLEDSATGVTLRAGAGIVADSVPGQEADEVDVKLGTVLDAVVAGSSARLR
jgi:menaquinone-specific isochorismate synthase